MRPFQSTIPLDDAQAHLAAAVRAITRVETVPLAQLAARVVAHDVVAAADVPPFARAMMDGYAVHAADTTGATPDTPRALTRVGRVFTGEVMARAVAASECAEIATGAPLPSGVDAVVMVEETTPGGGEVAPPLSDWNR